MFTRHTLISVVLACHGLAGCMGEPGPASQPGEGAPEPARVDLHGIMIDPEPIEVVEARRQVRLQMIKDAAASHGIHNALVIAAVAHYESGGLNHCWSEAQWGCKGPASSDCDGGPVLIADATGQCDSESGVGLFQVPAGAAQTGADDPVSVQANIEAGIEAMLDALWHDTAYTPAFDAYEDMIAWLDTAAPGTEAYDAFLEAMATLYHVCRDDSCPSIEYIRTVYDHAARDLIAIMGPDYWDSRPGAIYAKGSSCTCYNGTYHTGQNIDPNQTYCGLRVCGGENTVFECTAGGWQPVSGISCDYDGCSCSGGSDHQGTPVDPNVTECHFRVCGGDYRFYTCTTEGWRYTGVSCPNDSGTDTSCQCANGIDQNGNAIPPSSTYCGFETCGINDEHWLCTSGGWQKISNTCVSSPPSSTRFGYPVGDKYTSPAGGWSVWQVLAHYWSTYSGRHLAQDVGKSGAAYQPVYSVADGYVRVSAPNGSSYKNVILIEHDLGNGTKVCSFYGHLDTRSVSGSTYVTRGQQIGTVMNQSTNSHLHYVIMDKIACDHVAAVGGGLCGYDGGGSGNGVGHADLVNEPAQYTAVGTNPQNGCNVSGKLFYSPSKFIDPRR